MARRALALMAVPAAVLFLAGCSGDEPAAATSDLSNEPGMVAQEFLDALASGDAAGAAAMTTEGVDAFADCPWMASDDRTGGSIVGPKVGDVTQDGDHATAEATYQSGGEVAVSLGLSASGDAWTVDLPDGFAITASFSQPAVAQLQLADAGIEPGECGAAMADGQAALAAFPGTYNAAIVDPTGVVDYGNDLTGIVHVTGSGDEPWALGDPIGPDRLASLQADLASSGEAGTLTRVWTDDGQSWSAEVDDGGTSVTGTLGRDDDGALTFAAAN